MAMNDTAEMVLGPIPVSSNGGHATALLGALAFSPVVVLLVLALLRLLG